MRAHEIRASLDMVCDLDKPSHRYEVVLWDGKERQELVLDAIDHAEKRVILVKSDFYTPYGVTRPNVALEHLMVTALEVAPTEEVEKAFTQSFRKMFEDGCTTEEVTAAIASAISDGLKKGNWPK